MNQFFQTQSQSTILTVTYTTGTDTAPGQTARQKLLYSVDTTCQKLISFTITSINKSMYTFQGACAPFICQFDSSKVNGSKVQKTSNQNTNLNATSKTFHKCH